VRRSLLQEKESCLYFGRLVLKPANLSVLLSQDISSSNISKESFKHQERPRDHFLSRAFHFPKANKTDIQIELEIKQYQPTP
jgi:hypothetical protein